MNVNHTEQLHFSIKSPENFICLATTMLLEKDVELSNQLGHAWQTILCGDQGEQLFSQFLQEALPNGGTINSEVLEYIKYLAVHYLSTDEVALECQAEYDKHRYNSWVYFKPYHKVYPVGFAQHNDKIRELLLDYFRGIDTYDMHKFRNFLKNNIELRSDNTNIDSVLNDAENIHRFIVLENYIKTRRAEHDQG